jgi:citrate synthase
MRDAMGDNPSEEQVENYLKETMSKGLVIPGFGHAVLRITDPRFTCNMEFARRYMPNDVLCKIVATLAKVAPKVLQATGKVSNPFPNIDCHSGVLLAHFGLTEYEYYTVLFGVSRAIGCSASLVWSRALGLPLERPTSVTLDELEEYIKKG